ncbi:hypothetical protein GQ43DRAFT_370266 [Delitschia confertaspora ATCC 74209]|uniref:Uncharacterized protein n=1 Tax=Delitschia confertaspora ATCC 74209 TaxID=1513339 RepID=A0A9P4JMP5_9PLEO|nr:hypothetical protein GQ43DRAFT_370266 [Delitschia confertaspora ATCC 74209]
MRLSGPRLLRAPITFSSRPLSITARVYLKETGDRSPEELEAKKQEQLRKQEKGEGEWHESLGSNSEAHIKADRQDVKDHDAHMEKLQKEGEKMGEEDHGKR